ncbi:Asp-tRNA(Asn)/Glu-tRNA(Gln) amidotransferase subunit GatC [Marinomonas mediterranea]|jgi:aspartyl/glutamyl-tRNA(Asn/Gln) amidotransferase subunit C (EC 6.3.5.-)|uniref:Aspartyl/glutamyl-tRNA(Asn/Gln) amidotransferase subunit C n=1 Tax=Marinomonas mediterranea (strain ATCC 700492 / JCM 21426 / NBRC 103028 / MMB-1) TaxID=717774 RepID=F2K188_MARM1|nr:Asp-tRNA(Asn)/Glu-tRNA(Gln) amidotransferase subunit GatC [Marinomonas mediterranea]ADZ91019.1 Aspartyl/glutamyl-tRNA(Asn/Gln) amidotransferase subunit C [Marinomonas mediterranea MMB-1]WCN09056.1 Asp-tRNA(Asn)/Glu-tRNA(Gln) amidotransferase subunit GatC [Marinomonas mediterranea]WCN13088.1 Asp-tRNA(Asn)/Glu-tRNA(Gln) amidotransferase subunit GatC [Marinomonas mediterranea]WCN17158.1 Asp-tRNA(Asn)/Glu-tRNA(Gln) amidotransferase subunit GatC [Marinomonas mediterranea MMB-1]
MSLEKQDVQKIAHLARLSLSDQDAEEYQHSLSSVLDLVEQMQSVDTDGVEPLSNPLEATQRLREDVVTEQDRREAFLSNAPQTESGLFLVPQVID